MNPKPVIKSHPRKHIHKHEHHTEAKHMGNCDNSLICTSNIGVIPKSLPGREKLFSKVMTRSDIKHYRLAIPKHQAEKHFPQHFANSAEGASLYMEDNEGHMWSFRFSFWKSCQGYMITQDWNRFVQQKSLKAGDTVSFLRSTGPEKRFYVHSEPQEAPGVAAKPDPFESTPKGPTVKLFGVVISTT